MTVSRLVIMLNDDGSLSDVEKVFFDKKGVQYSVKCEKFDCHKKQAFNVFYGQMDKATKIYQLKRISSRCLRCSKSSIMARRLNSAIQFWQCGMQSLISCQFVKGSKRASRIIMIGWLA